MPNPAPFPLSAAWLNEALMARRDCVFRTIVHAAGLKHIIERQAAGDSLRLNPERPRRDHVHFAVPEPCGTTDIFDDASVSGLAHCPRAAILGSMLEPRKNCDIADALADGRCRARYAADLPKAALSLSESRRRLCCREPERRRSCRQSKCWTASHGGDISCRG